MRGAEDVWPEHDPELSSAGGWSDPLTSAALTAGLVLLAGFALRRRRSGDTTASSRPPVDRDRAGACVALLLVGASTCATLYLLASYQELTYSGSYSIDYYFNGSVVTLYLGYLPFCIGMGAALGVSVLGTVSLMATRSSFPHFTEKFYDAAITDDLALMEDLEAAVVHGHSVSFLIASALLVAALTVVLATMKDSHRNQPENGTADGAG